MQRDSSPSPAQKLDYQIKPARQPQPGRFAVVTFKAICLYFVISILTLPAVNAIWFEEIPVLALIQAPKTDLAHWMEKHAVIPAIKAMGLSRGSPSPDGILARPYALALAYLVGFGLVCLIARLGGRWTKSSWRWLWITLLAAILDFASLLWNANKPGLSIY